MKKRITEYLAYIDALLEKEDVDWEHEKEKHLVQIAFFAHERQGTPYCHGTVCIGNCDFNLVFEF